MSKQINIYKYIYYITVDECWTQLKINSIVIKPLIYCSLDEIPLRFWNVEDKAHKSCRERISRDTTKQTNSPHFSEIYIMFNLVSNAGNDTYSRQASFCIYKILLLWKYYVHSNNKSLHGRLSSEFLWVQSAKLFVYPKFGFFTERYSQELLLEFDIQFADFNFTRNIFRVVKCYWFCSKTIFIPMITPQTSIFKQIFTIFPKRLYIYFWTNWVRFKHVLCKL